jgi:DNA-binding response OmpR family regulator
VIGERREFVIETRPRIVVVEDDEDTRVFLEDLFESDGFAVRSAPDPESAYSAIDDWDPLVVILDVMLPRESGFDIYRAALRTRPDLAAIFVTAKPTDLPRIYARELGAEAFFRKPFDAEKLLASARAAAERAQKRERPAA